MVKVTLTPQQFEERKAVVAKETGTVLCGNDGEVAHQGCTLDYHYDGKSELTVQIKHKPFVVPTSLIEEKIRGWFQV